MSRAPTGSWSPLLECCQYDLAFCPEAIVRAVHLLLFLGWLAGRSVYDSWHGYLSSFWKDRSTGLAPIHLSPPSSLLSSHPLPSTHRTAGGRTSHLALEGMFQSWSRFRSLLVNRRKNRFCTASTRRRPTWRRPIEPAVGQAARRRGCRALGAGVASDTARRA